MSASPGSAVIPFSGDKSQALAALAEIRAEAAKGIQVNFSAGSSPLPGMPPSALADRRLEILARLRSCRVRRWLGLGLTRGITALAAATDSADPELSPEQPALALAARVDWRLLRVDSRSARRHIRCSRRRR